MHTAKPFHRSGPVTVAFLFILAGLFFGASRGFECFLLGLLVVPVLLLASAATVTVAFLARGAAPDIRLGVVMILLAPLAFLAASRVRDHAYFVVWALTHPRELSLESRTDGVITHWDGWGFAGNENDSYLVSAAAPDMVSADSATAWEQRQHLGCPIVAVEKIWQHFYVVTTYNCDFGL